MLSEMSSSLKVVHYQFRGWPDHSTPEYAGELLSLHKKVVAPNNEAKNGPILVHCR